MLRAEPRGRHGRHAERLALEVLAAVEREDRAFLEEVHLRAPKDGEELRREVSRRLVDFGLDGVDVRVRETGSAYELAKCCFAPERAP